MHAKWDREAERLETILPQGPRLVIIGSTSFWHPESERTCVEVGRQLAGIPGLLLITGGVEGVGETVGRSFFQARGTAGQEARVYHVLPEGEEKWDYGATHFAGSDMAERREVLGRLANVYVAVEGGPGTVHEAQVALSRSAAVLPVGRSGGHAADLYRCLLCPPTVDSETWLTLGSSASTPEEIGQAVLRAVQWCLGIWLGSGQEFLPG
jgi:uncharacterized protein (TIGR00725 family)